MRVKRLLWLGGVAAILGVGGTWIATQFTQAVPKAQPGPGIEFDVPYWQTPERVVAEMLKLARVTKEDVVYDLGCGDGRIVITAAKQYGARGLGVDIDPERIKESNANALKEGVTDRVQFVQRDLFKMELQEATVVTLYLLPEINLKLRPKLFQELKPGTRVVSHDYDMGDWQPEKSVTLRIDRGADKVPQPYRYRDHRVYYWTIPARKSD